MTAIAFNSSNKRLMIDCAIFILIERGAAGLRPHVLSDRATADLWYCAQLEDCESCGTAAFWIETL
jgi:hypothetical protein